MSSAPALSGENQEQLRQRGAVFSRNVRKSNSHTQTGISNPDGTFDLESDCVHFDEKVQFSAGRGGGGHFHVAATETDVGHSSKCTDFAAVGSEFDTAFAYYFVCLREKRGLLSLSVLQPELISRKVPGALKVGSTASACRRTTDDSFRSRWPFYPARVDGCPRR